MSTPATPHHPIWSRLPTAEAWRYHGVRWLAVVGLAILTYILFPVTDQVEILVPEVGAVATEEILAPFAFDVRKTAAEIEAEADELAASVAPIYDYRASVVDSLSADLDALFDTLAVATLGRTVLETARERGVFLTGEEAADLLNADRREAFRQSLIAMVRSLERGVVSGETLENQVHPEILIRQSDRETRVPRDSVLDRADYLAGRIELHPDPNSLLADNIFVKFLSAFFAETLVPNYALTEAQRAQRRAGVRPIKDRVQANERIINAHEVITPEARDRIIALRQELVDRGIEGGPKTLAILGQVLANGVVLTVFWLLLALYVPTMYRQGRELGTVTVLFALVIGGAALTHHFVHVGPELIPIPFAAVTLTVLFNGRISMVAAIVLAVLIGSQAAYGGGGAYFLPLLGGVGGALSVRAIRRRTHILTAAAVVTAAFALGAIALGMRAGQPIPEIGSSVVRGFTNATVSAALVFLALPIFEGFSHRTTDLTLLELSDPSQALLRRLATEVPGTYAHSLAVANLCEAATSAVGGNGLLARVGCYYHDIGKLDRPLHFAENQSHGGNPHDRLPPERSAEIIRGHVVEGVRLAEEHRLPRVIRDFIPEHHGTREIAFFLDRARKAGAVDPEVEHVFRYPGPRPRSVETAIAMLADGVEAVVRVIEDPTPATLEKAIDHVIKQRIDEGQLDDAPLTLGQLERVKDEFVRTLSGMHHNRIEYPKETGGITADFSAAARS